MSNESKSKSDTSNTAGKEVLNRGYIFMIVNILRAFFISTLFLDIFFWIVYYLLEKPFDALGWLRMTVDMMDFSHCTIRMDYVIQFLFLLLLNGIHGILFMAAIAIGNKHE